MKRIKTIDNRDAHPKGALRGYRRALSAIAGLAGIAASFLQSAPAQAGVYSYADTGASRTINCGILLADSAGQTIESSAPHDIVAPYVFYILSQRGDVLPSGWSIVNPDAPATITTEATELIPSANYQVGQPVTPNMAAYWQVDLTSAASSYTLGTNTLSQYNLLLIHTHNLIGLSRAEREVLRQYVDQGGTLWVEDCGNATTMDNADASGTLNPGGLFANVQFSDVAGTNGFAFFGDQYHHNPILTQPYFLTSTQINDLGDKDVAQYYMTGMQGGNSDPDPYLLVSAVGNTGHADANGNDLPYISVGDYGAGHIVIDNADIADAISNPVDPNGDTGNESGYCPSNLQAAGTNDLEFLVNMISWAGNDTPTDQANTRRTGAQVNATVGSGSLSKGWLYPDPNYNATSASSYYPTAPVEISSAYGSAISGNIVYTTAAISNAANTTPVPTLQAFDLIPSESLDGSGSPDDGVPGPSTNADSVDPYTGLAYQGDYSAGTSYDELWAAQPDSSHPAAGAQLSPPTIAAIGTGDFGSTGYYDSVLVEDDTGNVYIYDASSDPYGSGVTLPSTPVEPRGEISPPSGVVGKFSQEGYNGASLPVPAPVYYHGWLIAAEPQDNSQRPRVLLDYLPKDTSGTSPTLIYLDTGGSNEDMTPIIAPPAIGFIPSNDGTYGGSDLVCYVATRQAVYPIFLGSRDEAFSQAGTGYGTKVGAIKNGGEFQGIASLTYPPEDADTTGAYETLFPYLNANPTWDNGSNSYVGATTYPDFVASSAVDSNFDITVSGATGASVYGDYDVVLPAGAATNVVLSRHQIAGYAGASSLFPSGLSSESFTSLGVQGVALGPDNMLYVTVNENNGSTQTGYIEQISEQDPQIESGGPGTVIKWRFALTSTAADMNGDNIAYPFSGYEFIGPPVMDGSNVYALIYNPTTLTAAVLCFNPNPTIQVTLPPGGVQTANQTIENGNSVSPVSGINYILTNPNTGLSTITNFCLTQSNTNNNQVNPGMEVPDPLSLSGSSNPSGTASGTALITTGAGGAPLLDWWASVAQPNGASTLPGPLRRIGTQLYFAFGSSATGQTELCYVTTNPSSQNIGISSTTRELTTETGSTTTPYPLSTEPFDAGAVTTGLQGSGSTVIAVGSVVPGAGSAPPLSDGAIEALNNDLMMIADNDRLVEVDSNGQATWMLDSTIEPIVSGTSDIGDYDEQAAGTTYSHTTVNLSRPTSVSVLAHDDILFADSGNSRCVQVDRQGHVLWELTAFTDPNGLLQPGAPLTLNHPSSVTEWSESFTDTNSSDLPAGTSSAAGVVYHYLIADSGNFRVLLIDDVYVGNAPVASEYHVLRWVSHTSDNQGRQYRYVYADRFYGNEPTTGGGSPKTFIIAAVANKRIAPLIDNASNPEPPIMDSAAKDSPGSSVVFLEFDPLLDYDVANGGKAQVPSTGNPTPPTGFQDGMPVYLLNTVAYGSSGTPAFLPLRNLRNISSYIPVGSTVTSVLFADDDGVFDGSALVYNAGNLPITQLATPNYNLVLDATTDSTNHFSYTAADYAGSQAQTLNLSGSNTNPLSFDPVSVERIGNGDYLITNGAATGDLLQPQGSNSFTGNVFAVAPGTKALDTTFPVIGRYLAPSSYSGVVLTGPSNTGPLSQPSSAVLSE